MPTKCHWPLLAAPPELASDDAHVWAVPLDLSQQHYESMLATLASDERERATEFLFDDPRRRFVIAHGALRQLLSAYLRRPQTEISLAIDVNQKPRLAPEHAPANLHFNVSHSGDLAVIAFALGCEVGIDIEQLREVSHLEQIAGRFFHSSETRAVMSTQASKRNLAFLRCWTGKEAILKALGTGIVGNLADFQVPISNDWQGWVDTSHEGRARCWLEQLTPRDEYVVAVACVASKRVVRSYTFSM